MPPARILVVEDELIVAMDIERRLIYLGYEVVGRVRRGEEAIEKAGTTRPGLVLMDIRLKGEIGGIEAANAIRKQFSIPVVFLTAYADEPTLQRAKTAEPYGYLLKPFDETELGAVIKVALHKHAAVVAAQAQTGEALRLAEEQLKLFIELVSDYAIFMLDAKGGILTWNSGAERIKGYQSHEVIGKHFSIFFTAEEIRRESPERALRIAAEEGRFQMEGWRLRKDGSRFWADVIITAVRDQEGNIHGFGEVTRDITGQKQADEEIQKLNSELEQRVIERTAGLEAANKELEAFSYSVSHDLRAPLRAVDGFSQAVLEDYGPQLPEEGRRYLRTIRREAQRMGMLIDDLLTFSRLSRAPLNKRKVDTGELIRSVLKDLSDQQGGRQIELRTGELPSCAGDPALLKQVWINLLSNAFKYTQKREAAVIEIGCEHTAEGDVYFVRDNGTGFDMRYANRLFGVFQRLHRAEEFEGTGVGLAIVQRVVQRHGGRVWAEAEEGRGATFRFTLEGKNQP